MDLVSFSRMSQTCREIHEFMEKHSKEFNINTYLGLEFFAIDDNYRKRLCESEDRVSIPFNYHANFKNNSFLKINMQ